MIRILTISLLFQVLFSSGRASAATPSTYDWANLDTGQTEKIPISEACFRLRKSAMEVWRRRAGVDAEYGKWRQGASDAGGYRRLRSAPMTRSGVGKWAKKSPNALQFFLRVFH